MSFRRSSQAKPQARNHLERRPRIAVIGAGPTGLTNALLLSEAGFDVTVFESSERIGGKIHTYDGFRVNGRGPRMEKGPEFIDGRHDTVRFILDKIGVKLDRINDTGGHLLIEDHKGHFHREEEVGKILKSFWKQAIADCEESLRRWPEWTPLALALNNMSMQDYLNWRLTDVPAADVWAVDALKQIFTSDFGMEATRLNALSFVTAFGSKRRSNEEFSMRGESDEGFKVVGGMQRIPEGLKKAILKQGGQQRLMIGCPVTRVVKTEQGMKLYFTPRGKDCDESRYFDSVVSAADPAALRRIEGVKALLPPAQYEAICHTSDAMVNKIALETHASPHLLSANEIFKESDGDLICTHDPDIQAVFTARKGHSNPYEPDLAVFYFGGDRAGDEVSPERVQRLKMAYAKRLGKSVKEIFTDRAHEVIHEGGAHTTSCYFCPAVKELAPQTRLLVANQNQNDGFYVTGQFIPSVSGRALHVGYIEDGMRSAMELSDLLKEKFATRLRLTGQRERRER